LLVGDGAVEVSVEDERLDLLLQKNWLLLDDEMSLRGGSLVEEGRVDMPAVNEDEKDGQLAGDGSEKVLVGRDGLSLKSGLVRTPAEQENLVVEIRLITLPKSRSWLPTRSSRD
jgi:hypothetical protein